MKLAFTKISRDCIKVFYDEDGQYGEFYINFITNPDRVNGYIELRYKDLNYADALMDGFSRTMVDGVEMPESQTKQLKETFERVLA